MSYITWEYYSSLYSNISDQEEFDKISKRAEIKFNSITHMRAKRFEDAYNEDTATDFQQQVHVQIQDTFCQLLNTIEAQDASGMGTGMASRWLTMI